MARGWSIAVAALRAVLRRRGSGIALPGLEDLDLGTPLVGFCGLGFRDIGTARLHLTRCLLENPGSLRLAAAPAWRTAGGWRLVLPLAFDQVSVRGRWEIRHLCRAIGQTDLAAVKNVRGDGEFAVRLGAGSCELAVGITFSRRPRVGFRIDWPGGFPPVISWEAACAEGHPDSVRHTVGNYLALARGSRRAGTILSRFVFQRIALPVR